MSNNMFFIPVLVQSTRLHRKRLDERWDNPRNHYSTPKVEMYNGSVLVVYNQCTWVYVSIVGDWMGDRIKPQKRYSCTCTQKSKFSQIFSKNVVVMLDVRRL
jgi:hypothetical protein